MKGRIALGDAGSAMLEFAESFEDFRAEAEQFIDAGNSVVVALRERGRARGGSVELDQVFGILYTLRDGKVAHIEDRPRRGRAGRHHRDRERNRSGKRYPRHVAIRRGLALSRPESVPAGLIVHLKDYGNRVLSLQAVGLSEE